MQLTPAYRRRLSWCVKLLAVLPVTTGMMSGNCQPNVNPGGNTQADPNTGAAVPAGTIGTTPPGQSQTGPAFPHLLSPCPNGVTSDCRVGLSNLLATKLIRFESTNANGQQVREYLALCLSLNYTYAVTLVDGVSPAAQSQISFFDIPQGEKLEFLTTSVFDADIWEVIALANGDVAVVIDISTVEPNSTTNQARIGQRAFFIINTDANGNLYFNGLPAAVALPGNLCIGL